MLPKIGAHVDQERPLAAAAELGVEIIQIFLGKPQGWEKPPPRDDAAELRDSPVDLYIHAPYLINVCSPKPNIRYGSRKILSQQCEAAGDARARGADRPPRPCRGRDRRGRQALEPHARDAGERGPGLPREHGRRRQRGRPARSTRWRSSGSRSRPPTPRSRSASASTPATPTPPARTSPTSSSGCARSPAASTSSTPTTRATRRAPAPTATPTSAPGRWTPTTSAGMIRACEAPVRGRDPGRRPPGRPRVRARGTGRLSRRTRSRGSSRRRP